MSFTLTMMEFILLIFGAIVVGITIHFFAAGRKRKTAENSDNQSMGGEWHQKYESDIALREAQIADLQQQLRTAEENAAGFLKEAEELRLRNAALQSEIETLRKKAEDLENETKAVFSPATAVSQMPEKADYLDQLLFTQSRLMEQNEKITQVLGSLEVLKEREEKQRQILRDNAELVAQISRMRGELTEKEREINNMKQKEHLTKEMASMLDTAYAEFNTLQHTIKQLESKLTVSRMAGLEYEDIKDEYSRLMKEVEAYRTKTLSLTTENQQLHQELTAIKEKLNESDFHRQQLQKRITHLSELNADLQLVAEANKKLEGQLKQIGKLENMLNTIAEERGIHLRGDA